MFHIVEFIKEKEVEVIPSNWLSNLNGSIGLCHWPPIKSTSKVKRLVKSNVLPEKDWKAYDIRSIAAFVTYEEAKRHLKKAEETSDLQSEAEQPSNRGRKRPAPSYESEASDEESESLLPHAPQLPTTNTPTFNLKTHSGTPQNLVNMNPPITHTSQHPQYSAANTPNPVTFDSVNTHWSPTANTSNNTHWSPNTSQHTQYLATNTSNSLTFDSISTHWSPHTSQQSHYLSNASKTPTHNNTPPPCSCNQLQIQILKNIQKTMEAHTAILQTHSNYLLKLLKHPSSDVSSIVPINAPSNFPLPLPLKKFEDLAPVEEYLKEEKNFSEMVSYLASFGGQGTKKIMKRVVPELIAQELAVQLNWKGRGDKRSFHEYSHIHGVIYHAVKINATGEKVTLTDVESFLKDWLRFAPDRSGGHRHKNKIN